MKNVLITGAAKRLGRAIALDLATAGWNVAIHYNSSPDAAQAVAAEIRGHGVKAATLKADLGRESESQALVALADQVSAWLRRALA